MIHTWSYKWILRLLKVISNGGELASHFLFLSFHLLNGHHLMVKRNFNGLNFLNGSEPIPLQNLYNVTVWT